MGYTIKMPTDFPTWYASVQAGDADKTANRWEGLVKAASILKVEEIESLVRIALKTHQAPLDDVVTRFVEAVRSTDPTFGTVAAEREKQILAASLLVALLATSQLAAIALTTSGLDGARKLDLPFDIFAMAENAVRTFAASSRVRVAFNELAAPKVEWSITEAEVAQTTPQKMVSDLAAAANKTLALAMQRQNAALKSLAQRQALADEESQMLWWLIGGHLSSGEAINELDITVRPLAVARDLAQRTVAWPGPLAIPALLSRVGLERTANVVIADAVNAMDDAWSAATLQACLTSPVIHPIHEAIRRRNETGKGTKWVANWAAVCEIEEGFALPAIRLSELFYREHVLLTIPA